MNPPRFPLPVLGEASHSPTEGSEASASHSCCGGGSCDCASASAEPAKAAEPKRDVTQDWGYHKSYWRSIAEKLDPKRFAKERGREFPPGASEPPKGLARRDFLQILGASMALAGLTACSERPNEPILAYTKNPDNLVPGDPLHYATAWAQDGHATGLLVKAREGRPIKIEGNPEHPTCQGKTGAYEQALTIELYDPQRARSAHHAGHGASWRELRQWLVAEGPRWAKDGGAGLRFWMEPSASPLGGALRDEVRQRFPKAEFFSHTPLSQDNALEGARIAFGTPLELRYSLEDADVLLALDADFLEPLPRNLHAIRGYASRRDDLEKLNRLYAVESRMSITGASADQRLRLKPSQIEGFARALASELATEHAAAVPALSAFRSTPIGRAVSVKETKWVKAVARDLASHPGRTAVLVGENQPPRVHALVHAINGALGNIGKTVSFFPAIRHEAESAPSAWKKLRDDLEAGKVDTLVITAWNPVYSAPADLDVPKLLKKAKHVVYLSQFEDETAAVEAPDLWFVPQAHVLESWGDARALDGTTSIIQPLLRPLFGGITEADLLAGFLDRPEQSTYEMLQGFWKGKTSLLQKGLAFEWNWETWVKEGLVPDQANAPVTPSVIPNRVALAVGTAPAETKGLEIAFVPHYGVYDGRYANAPWLEEMPDPITKVTWDNPAMVSQATFDEIGLVQPTGTGWPAIKDNRKAPLAEVTFQGRKLTVPVIAIPGHPDDVITLPLGFGRFGEGEQVAKGQGYNAYALRTSDALWFAGGAKVVPGHGDYDLSSTQEHWVLQGRDGNILPDVAISQTLKEFRHDPLVEEARGKQATVLRPVTYEGYQWAMAIDMNRCTGCAACVIACQAENNIPSVGKEQVHMRREMHWIRIDRYFQGEVDDPKVINQPMACQHCETAPCEYVCPVNATTHSDEGLNDMTYNRCIGTRYCSNNCPYKVRRFNYLHWTGELFWAEDWTQEKRAVHEMAMNPDVTVRDRGVMEKCTYCVQRIERARIDSRIAGHGILEKDLQTACQQACPAHAISFGTLSDAESTVSKKHRDERRYDSLHYLDTRPRTAYLSRVTNPNPDLENA